MGILEKITEALHNNEEETVELRQEILKLILDDLKLSNNCLKECLSEELESNWKALSVARKGFAETVKLREEKLNDQEKMVERVWEEVEFERKQIEEKLMGIIVKEKELNRIQRWVYQETHAIELKDQELAKKIEKFHVKEDALELKDQELAEKMEDFHVKEVNLMSMKENLEVKEMGLESVKKGLVIQGSKLDSAKNELRVNENENKLDCVKKELKENENKLVFVKKDVTFQESKLDSVKKELRVNENKLDCVREELKESENKLESVKKDVIVEVSKLDSVKKEVGVNESKMEILNEELREKESDLEAVNKALAVKENRLDVVKKLVRAKEGILEMLREKEKKLDYVKRDLNENEYKLESLKKDLTIEKSKLDSVKKEVGVNVSKLEILKKEVTEKENDLEYVNNVLAVKENRLDGVNNVLREKESSLDYLEEEFRETQKGLDYVKKDLNGNVNNLEAVSQALAVRESRLEILKRELIEKEDNLEAVNKVLAVKENRLDGVKKALKVQQSNLDYLTKELSVKEKTVDYLKKELREKETNLDSMKKELAVKENMLDSMKKELTLNESNLDVVTKELKEKGKNLDFVKTELRERENELESVKKEFKAEADNLNALRKQVESEEEILSSTKKKLEHKEKFQEAMKKKLELQEEHLKSFIERLHLRERELDYTQEAYKQRFEELHSKERKLDSAEEVTGKSYEGFQSEKRKFLVEQGLFEQRMKDVILREERIKNILEELESREKHVEDRSKELREKQKQLNAISNAHLKTELNEDVAVDRVNTIVGNSAVTKFVVMDGKSLQIFLNEHEKELDLMSDDVFEALQMSPDPAKLVLDAMEGFYPPHLRKGETEFEASVARQSCILLLEQLIRVSPEIRDFERRVARKIARDWKVKIEATKGNQDEILGFLYLLAAYNLVSSFGAHELIILLEIVAKHDKFAELCRSLGMKQNLPCFVQNLLTKQQHLEAIRYVYAFELVDQFPPTAILKDYLECVEHNYVDVYKKETCSVEEKIEAIERRVASVRAVIRCILDYKLQSQYPVEELEERIELLTRQKEEQAALSVICDAKKPEQANVNQMGSSNPSFLTGTKAPACTLGHSNAMAIILMNMSGKNLQNFLNKHLKEHKLLRSEVFSAILMSLDSATLVLEALEGFYPSEHQKEEIGFHRDIIRQSCILLLEQLMELSPGIKPEAKLEASKLAFAWKAKMMAEMENHLAILGFLLLVGCYRLASAFDKDELESLYHKVAQHVNTSEICHVLGISNNTSRTDDYPSVEESKRRKAQGCTDKSICSNMDMKGEGQDVICNCVSSLHRTSNPALLVLDALRSCHPVKLVRFGNFPSVLRSFSDLLDQLREVSPDIEHHVKMEAILFAVDWYSKLNRPQLNPTEVTAFLQLLAIYRITDSFHSDGLLGLLEKVQPTERVVTVVKILGLTDKIRYFVQNLRNKKQWLVAFKYVYAFELFDLVSPVSLLKDYVRHSEQIAEQKLHAGNSSHRSQMKAINFEMNALRITVKQIVDHGLQSEYSPSYLQERIEKLLYQLSNLRQSNSNRDFTAVFQQVRTNKGTCGSAPLAQVQKELTKKRPAPGGGTDVIYRAERKQNFKRHCHLSMRS